MIMLKSPNKTQPSPPKTTTSQSQCKKRKIMTVNNTIQSSQKKVAIPNLPLTFLAVHECQNITLIMIQGIEAFLRENENKEKVLS